MNELMEGDLRQWNGSKLTIIITMLTPKGHCYYRYVTALYEHISFHLPIQVIQEDTTLISHLFRGEL